ncbi:IS3 family transposase [Bacillus sp. NPDC094077]|uniref:IS3 family transposase n=1 Tax=Bacillus sp. NPDC094077 TaxID=3390932 RepID=UPI003D07706B
MGLTIKNYMEEYHYTRYKCILKKMNPVVYRIHLLSVSFLFPRIEEHFYFIITQKHT